MAITFSPHVDNTGFVTGLTIVSSEFCFLSCWYTCTVTAMKKTSPATEEKALTENIFKRDKNHGNIEKVVERLAVCDRNIEKVV